MLWLLLGVLLALGVRWLVAPYVADATSETFVWWGTVDEPPCYAWGTLPGYGVCWHDDETSPDPWTQSPATYTAIDFDSPAGTLTQYYTSLGYSWLAQFGDVTGWYSACKTLSARMYFFEPIGNGWVYVGDIHYKHIDISSGVDGSQTQSRVYDIGHVASRDTDACVNNGWWYGAHLHQSGNIAYWTLIWDNKPAFNCSSGCLSWEHALIYRY